IYSTELEKYKNQLASLQFLYERLKDEMAYLRVYTDELKSVAQLLNIARQYQLLPFQIENLKASATYKYKKSEKGGQKKNDQKPTNILNELLDQYPTKGSSPQTGGKPSYLQPQPNQTPEINKQNKNKPTNLYQSLTYPVRTPPINQKWGID
ncbi:MAG: hypothetical protein ACP5QM_06835, partial [Caldisericum sp.]|uniref:hypothetical protein n=1 Tax=Caldisericum sp. TaxID=2499687 RepID=UPI003D131378